MYIYQIAKEWFVSRARIDGRLCFGYGRTSLEAMQDTFKDYQIIKNL